MWFSRLQMYVLGAEHLVDTAVPFPEDHFTVCKVRFAVAAELGFERVPNRHLAVDNPHLKCGVSPQMLVWEE